MYQQRNYKISRQLVFQDRLAGSVSGVQITSTSGQPDCCFCLRIRGMGSINASNEPLYVVDGFLY